MKRKREILIDEKCWELAEHFLRDEPIQEEDRSAMTKGLAQHIQQAVEDWLNTP